jgi:hypothetical protein
MSLEGLKLLFDLNSLKLDRKARANGSGGYDTVKQIRLRNNKQLKAILTPQIQSNTGVSFSLSSQNHLISIASVRSDVILFRLLLI